MKLKFLLITAITFVAFGCDDSPKCTIDIENSIDMDRVDEPVVFSRDVFKSDMGDLVPVLMDQHNNPVTGQVDDLDGDGKWDELAVLVSLKGNKSEKYTVKWVKPAKYPEFPVRTNIRYGKLVDGKVVELATDSHAKSNLARGEGYPYQMEGPVWENDKMGFGHYFDGRNSRQVFGKRVKEMVLDGVGIREDGTLADTYHVMADWGRDILTYDDSFGLGGLALRYKNQLTRLGVTKVETTDNVDSTTFRIITEGPVRSIFAIDFKGWQTPAGKIESLTQKSIIWAGKYGYETQITTSVIPEGAELVTGIITNNLNTAPVFDTTTRYATMMTFDKQTTDKEFEMGMALVVPRVNFASKFDAPISAAKGAKGNILKTWCAALKPDKAGEYNYYVYATWEKSVDSFSKEAFQKMVLTENKRLTRPYHISVTIETKVK